MTRNLQLLLIIDVDELLVAGGGVCDIDLKEVDSSKLFHKSKNDTSRGPKN